MIVPISSPANTFWKIPSHNLLLNVQSQQCGAVAGEEHPYDSGRKTRLHIGHIVDKSMAGSDEPNNLRAICSVCNEGSRNLTLDRPTATKLLIQIRRAKIDDQLEVFNWLQSKFNRTQ
jgi:5-methylcytosine-specific restriction endonuclease McrA